MKELIALWLYLVGVWFQADEFRDGSVEAKLALLRQSPPGLSLIHFNGKAHWMEQIVASAPAGAELAWSCSSIERCQEYIGSVPAGVGWILYDLEPGLSGAGALDPAGSIAEMVAFTHGVNRKLWLFVDDTLAESPGYDVAAAGTDAFLVNGAAYQLTGIDYVASVTAAVERCRRWNPDAKVYVQVRMNRYRDGAWDSYFPPETQDVESLFKHYVLPIVGIADGIVAMDYADDSHPDPTQRRPALYRRVLAGASGEGIRSSLLLKPYLTRQ